MTKVMVLKAYGNLRANKGGAGVDGMSWAELDANLQGYLYALWNRLSSGSYFPAPVLQVEIPKKSGGVRPLGISTLLDRIAQQVVRDHLEKHLEPIFHGSSFGSVPVAAHMMRWLKVNGIVSTMTLRLICKRPTNTILFHIQ